MTKIEEYNEKKAFAQSMKNLVNGLFEERGTDKFGAVVKLSDTYRGRYGDSATYSWGDEETKYIEEEIRKNLRGLAANAYERAEKEAEDARLAARGEAEEILKATKKVAT